MKVLLDTHVLIWFRACPERLGKATLKLLGASETEVAISVVSSLEVAQLVSKGKVSLPCDVSAWMTEGWRIFSCEETPITTKICDEAYRLPGEFHADPADRLLVATARVHRWSIVTADRRILDYRHVTAIPAEQ